MVKDHSDRKPISSVHVKSNEREGNVLLNELLNTFSLRVYGVGCNERETNNKALWTVVVTSYVPCWFYAFVTVRDNFFYPFFFFILHNLWGFVLCFCFCVVFIL